MLTKRDFASPCVTTSGAGDAPDDFGSADLGLARQQRLAEQLTCDRPRLLLLWRCPKALIVGRNDMRLQNFADAADRLRAEGWPVVIRRSGGGACPVSKGTLQIALARIALPKTTIDTGYIELAAIIRSALESYGLKVEVCEQPAAFCPGRYDISVNGGKIAGLSQHWRPCNGHITATTAATLIVDEDTEELARIVNLFYLAAGGRRHCSPSRIGAVRHALPADAVRGMPLMDELCKRIATASTARLVQESPLTV